MVRPNALRKLLVPSCVCLLVVSVATLKKMREVGAQEEQEQKVTLCHVPPGNPENAHTIEVSESAVEAHLAHGDILGECEEDGNDDGGEDGENEIVTICHIPPGNPENAHTIEVSESAVDAHLAHGDILGECEEDGNDDGGEDGENEKVTICHIPPGNPENAHTIEVSESAVEAHLAHGDILGECEEDGNDDGGEDGENEKVTICHIPPGNPENAHTIEISESAVSAHLAHGDILGECEEDGNDDGGEDGENEKVTICHIPPGNPENAHTIEISESAVPAHLAHGDILGECPSESDDGSLGSGREGGSGADPVSGGDKDSSLIQQQAGTPDAFGGLQKGEMNICGYITPVSLMMMFAGLMLMRVGVGRRRL